MHLALEQFNSDLERIFWVLTFFKSRWAAKWSKNLFYMEADTTNILEGSFYYQIN